MTLELFVSAYATTSLVMFPILVFIVVLLIRDLGKYSKLSEDIEEKGFKKDQQESLLSHISRFINKK
jgi:large-conductance mechanosensitive channel